VTVGIPGFTLSDVVNAQLNALAAYLGWQSGSRGTYVAVGTSAAGLVAGIYAPGLRELLGTTPLSAGELGLTLAIGAIPAAIVEIVKVARQRHS
jgi:Cation transporting ATPase, C-terminus